MNYFKRGEVEIYFVEGLTKLALELTSFLSFDLIDTKEASLCCFLESWEPCIVVKLDLVEFHPHGRS